MFLLVNKPKGITSHDVINKLRISTGERKIGHAGTLDPNASGLLIVGIGRESTSQLSRLLNLKKTYIADIFLGEERETDDVEGKVRFKNTITKPPELGAITSVVSQFMGKQKQMPPIYSSIKIKGKEAYKRARSGESVEMKMRDIEVYLAKIINYNYPTLIIEFKVSSGTYIRSLARDLGRELKTGAFLNNLIRTKVGEYTLENSSNIDEINNDNWRTLTFDL